MVTQKKIAEILGISRTTVARALKENAPINKKTKEKVLALMEETNYQKNYLGSSLAGKKKVVYAFLVKSKNKFYTNEMKRGISTIKKEYEKYKLEVKVFLHDVKDEKGQEEDLKKVLKTEQIDGLFLVPLNKEGLYSVVKPYIKQLPIFSFTISLHPSITHIGIDYREQGKIVAGILSHCLRENETLIVLDNGDDKLSTKDYLEGFMQRILEEPEIRILGPYTCNGIENSIELLKEIEKKEKITSIFSNRYAQDIFSLLPENYLYEKKIVLSGMGEKVVRLLKTKKIIATVMEEVYEQVCLGGKMMFGILYQNHAPKVTWNKTDSKIIYLENFKKN